MRRKDKSRATVYCTTLVERTTPVRPVQPIPVEIPPDLLQQVFRHAREAFPEECCGWLSGPRDGASVDALRRAHNAYQADAHPAAPDRSTETAYVIAGDDLLALAHSIDDGASPARIIYHSHPNGRAYFSATDRQAALDPWGGGPLYPVQQLVVGIDEWQITEAKLFDWNGAQFVEIATYPGSADA